MIEYAWVVSLDGTVIDVITTNRIDDYIRVRVKQGAVHHAITPIYFVMHSSGSKYVGELVQVNDPSAF